MAWGVYAYLCTDCDHLAHKHGLSEDGDLREGPYRCPCGCEQPQDGAFVPLTRAQFADWEAHGEEPTDA